MAESRKSPPITSVPAFVVFLVCFSTALFFVNEYIFERFFSVAGVTVKLPLLITLSAFPAVLFVLSTYLSRKHEGRLLLGAYYAASFWLGFSVFAFPSLVISDIAAVFLPGIKQVLHAVVLAGALLTAVYASFKAGRLKINEISVPLGKGLTVVQVSDAHYGIINGSECLKELVKLVNSLKPDIVCFTGDLVDGTKVINEDTFLPLKELNAPAFFVAGNHEMIDGLEIVLPALEKGGVKVLDGEEVEVKGIRIIGLGYSWDKKSPGKFIDSHISDQRPSIFLLHEPVVAEKAAEKGISLMLSGHTHAGQIIPFNLLVRIPYKYIAGRYQVGNMVLNVSTGFGTWGPVMRLGSDCEINVIKI